MRSAGLRIIVGLAALLWVMPVPAVSAAAASQTGVATADGPQVHGVSQEDTNGDGKPDLMTLNAAIATQNDRVLVFDGGGNMRTSDRWEEATDFTDDTWVFDIGGEGGRSRATLIIRFSREGNDTLARIYDGTTTRGVVRYERGEAGFRVTAPAYPSMIIRARGGWTRADGGLNYNLIWQYDGPAASREYSPVYPYAFRLDGQLDMEGAVGDEDNDGIPDYSWYTLTAAVYAGERIPRTSIAVNAGHKRPAALRDVVFWPLLNQPEDPKGHNYYDTPLFLGIDWQQGLITSFTFQGYPIEQGYHVNSLTPMVRGRVNALNFENPMAYYDLAGDNDGLPELFIRLAYTPPDDEYFLTGTRTRTPMEMVQYSWNQKNHAELRWDYKVDVAGRNPISQTVQIGDMTIEQVPYAELPHWTVQQPWGIATLVAFESGNGYLSSEGIYDWSTLEGVQSYGGIYAGSTVQGVESYTQGNAHPIPQSEQIQRDYLGGVSTQSPASLYSSMLAGFRGEYADVNGQVWLYFSPIDARLHLVGVDHGIYNAGNNRRVAYANLDGDSYIDSWQVYRGNEKLAALRQSARYLVYDDESRVVIQQSAVERELFRTQPPADHEEWAALGGRLDAVQGNLLPDDLGPMLAQFGGPRLTVTGASLRDYRPLGQDSFRFVLDLGQDFTVEGDLLPLAGRKPGLYVVTFDGEKFTVRPWSAPAISAQVMPAALTEEEIGIVPVVIRNAGLQDVAAATVELWAEPFVGESRLVVTRTLTLNAETTQTTQFEWAPPAAGEWTLTPRVKQPNLEGDGATNRSDDANPEPSADTGNGELQTDGAATVTVSTRTSATPGVVFAATTSPVTAISVVFGFAACAVLAGWIVWRYWGNTMNKRRNHAARH